MQKVARQLGRYHVLDRISYGGMAEIFRAITFQDRGQGLLVAIKQVLPHYAKDREFIDMLVDEAKLVSMLHHPNIVEIYEVGHVDEFYFLAMEFVWGKDLRSVLERSRNLGIRIPFEVSAYLLAEALAGLDTAHRLLDPEGKPASLVHRDFSPSNILISYHGDVKICDFGIAKANFSRTETKTGVIKGKVKYMSPEQAFGRKLDHRSDLFSSGSVFYEMLTGKPPFLANNEIDLIFIVRDANFTPPRQIVAEIPSELEKAVYHSMARARGRRYQSAAEFRFSLLTYLRNRGSGNWKAELGRFMHALYTKEIKRERYTLTDYELGNQEIGAADLGRNLIADVLGQNAAYTKFNPYPTQARHSPRQIEEVHDASTRIIDPAEINELKTVVKESPDLDSSISEHATRILQAPEPANDRMASAWSEPQDVHVEQTARTLLADGSGDPPSSSPPISQQGMPAASPMPYGSSPPKAPPPQFLRPASQAHLQMAAPIAPPPAQSQPLQASSQPMASASPMMPSASPYPRSEHPMAAAVQLRPAIPAPPPQSGSVTAGQQRRSIQSPAPKAPPPAAVQQRRSSSPALQPHRTPPPAAVRQRRPMIAPNQTPKAPPPAASPAPPPSPVVGPRPGQGFRGFSPSSIVTGPPPAAPPPAQSPVSVQPMTGARQRAGTLQGHPGPQYRPPSPGGFGGNLDESDIDTFDYDGQYAEERTHIAESAGHPKNLIEADTQEDARTAGLNEPPTMMLPGQAQSLARTSGLNEPPTMMLPGQAQNLARTSPDELDEAPTRIAGQGDINQDKATAAASEGERPTTANGFGASYRRRE